MRHIRLLAVCVLPCSFGLPLLIGCGGGNSTSGAGRASLTIIWPDRSKLIPLASNSIQLTFTRGAQSVASQLIPRPVSGNQTQTTFSNLKTGTLTLTATAFPNSDGTGVAQATGSTPVNISSGQTTAVTLTMASTIDHLDLSPVSPSVSVGQTLQLVATAKDIAGNVVLMSAGKLQWGSDKSSVASVDSNGIVTGVASGQATITVTDTESGKSASELVIVNTISTPKKIAFQRVRNDGGYDIWVMNTDGSSQQQLTNSSGTDHVPSWSPDGKKIVFVSTRDGNGEIYTMNADGSGQVRLTNNSADDYAPAFSPDGTKIIFSSDRSGTRQLYTMALDGSGQTQITNMAGDPNEPSYSPDGTKVVFSTFNYGVSSQVIVMNADGSAPTTLTTSGTIPVWLTNARIVFMSIRDGNWELYAMNEDGTGQTNLTNNPAYDSDPHCSSDGTRIAMCSQRDAGVFQIYSMNADGSNVTRLTFSGQSEAHPEWQP